MRRILHKALARVSSVPTPADGNTVMKLESRIAAYRADLPKLKRELAEAGAALELVGLKFGMPATKQPNIMYTLKKAAHFRPTSFARSGRWARDSAGSGLEVAHFGPLLGRPHFGPLPAHFGPLRPTSAHFGPLRPTSVTATSSLYWTVLDMAQM